MSYELLVMSYELCLKRIARRAEYTIGRMYVDGRYFCDTLEDKDRGLTQEMKLEQIERVKIYGQTAIPMGRYRVRYTYSARFKRYMPLLVGVKGFEGIRIHSGNTAADTLGCILLGENRVKGKVLNSRAKCREFDKLVEAAIKNGGEVWLRIE